MSSRFSMSSDLRTGLDGTEAVLSFTVMRAGSIRIFKTSNSASDTAWRSAAPDWSSFLNFSKNADISLIYLFIGITIYVNEGSETPRSTIGLPKPLNCIETLSESIAWKLSDTYF